MPKLNKLAMELNAIMQIGKLVKSKVETIWFPSGIPAHEHNGNFVLLLTKGRNQMTNPIMAQ